MDKRAFVIMSFSEEYDIVYQGAIKPALASCKYSCLRGHEDTGPAMAQADIIRQIISADVVIADISEPSPNVFYELGVSHSVGNKTIVISQRVGELPFDTQVCRVIPYQMGKERLRLLRSDIEAAVRHLGEADRSIPNNLVQEAGRDYFDLRAKIRENLEALREQRSRTKAYVEFRDSKRQGRLQDNTAVADKMICQISAHAAHRSSPLLVCLCGPGAIGKSTFAELLVERIEKRYSQGGTVDILSTDSYLLTREQRVHRNIIGYGPDTHRLDRLVEDVQRLAHGHEITIHPYDHGTGTALQPRNVGPTNIIIVEGVYSLYPPIAMESKGLRYYIYADKMHAKELKFVADVTERGYDVQTAFLDADKLYESYESHTLPFLRSADYVIMTDKYWQYRGPYPPDEAPGLTHSL